MEPGDLLGFWVKYQRNGKRADCAELLGGRFPGYTVVAGDLGAYAANKATAIRCRLEGHVDRAMVYEDICDRIYQGLPDRARW